MCSYLSSFNFVLWCLRSISVSSLMNFIRGYTYPSYQIDLCQLTVLFGLCLRDILCLYGISFIVFDNIMCCLQEDADRIDRMIEQGEATYEKFRHPDPYVGE